MDIVTPECAESQPGLNINISYSDISFFGTFRDLPEWEVALKLSIYLVVILLSLIGNTTVVALVACRRSLRTITNYYVINLGVSDLISTMFALWVHPVDDVTQGWVLGPFVCKINTFISSKYLSLFDIAI